MRRQPWGLYAIAMAIMVVGLVALGVPASTVLFAALVMTCPLMMFMMGGTHGGHGAADQDREPGSGTPGSRTSDRHHHEPRSGRW